jgi:aryl carrier-like protein
LKCSQPGSYLEKLSIVPFEDNCGREYNRHSGTTTHQREELGFSQIGKCKGTNVTILRDRILLALEEVAEMRGTEVNVLTDETILLESGLDSLGFAILVAKLEEEFGYDPFVLMDVPVYPRTFGEFIEIYQRFSPL